MKWLFLLLSCLPCLAQFPYSGTTWSIASSGGGVQANLSNVFERWVFTDLTNNSSLSSGWVGEIQGEVWTNGNSATTPTNSYSGVWFDNSHFLTNKDVVAGLNGWSNVAFGFIINIADTGQYSSETHPGLLNNTLGKGADDGTVAGYMFHAAPYNLTFQNNSAFTSLSESPFLTTNQWSDLIAVQVVTNSGGGSYIYSYTNGIADNAGANQASGVYWASGADKYPNSLAFNYPRSSSAFFRLQELWIWTNANSGSGDRRLDSNLIYSFHSYATNLMQISSFPAGKIDIVGSSLSTSVTANNVKSYQWRRTGSPIAGATTSALSIGTQALSDSAMYDVQLTDYRNKTITVTFSNIVVTTATVSNWVASVTTNGGVCPTITTASSVDTYWNGMVTDAIDTNTVILNVFVPDNLTAAITPLVKGTGSSPWVNHSFVSGDLTVNGLKGDGSTKYLDTGLVANTLPNVGTSFAIYAYATNGPGSVGTELGATHAAAAGIFGACGYMYFQNGAGANTVILLNTGPGNGFYASVRTSSTDHRAYFATSGSAFAQTGATDSTADGAAFNTEHIYSHALNSGGSVIQNATSVVSMSGVFTNFTSAKAQFLYNRTQTLRTALGGGYR